MWHYFNDVGIGHLAPVLSVLALAVWFTARRPADRDIRRTPIIALVGCDGAGKSTLAADMSATIGANQATAMCYLGLGSGEIGNRIQQWPIIGKRLEVILSRRAGQARTKSAKQPGVATVLVILIFSLMRRHRFRRMLALQRKGVIVFTDRYPQNEVAGLFDGPGLSAARAEGFLFSRLVRWERGMYDWMVSYQPSVVIRLNVDAETALRRKPDHKADLVRQKVEIASRLRFAGANIVDLNAMAPYQDVRKKVLQIVSRTIHDMEDRPVANDRGWRLPNRAQSR